MTILVWQRLADRLFFDVQKGHIDAKYAIRFGEFRGVQTLEFDSGNALRLTLDGEAAILSLAKAIVNDLPVQKAPISLPD